VAGELFAHCAVHAEPARSRQEQGKECSQIADRGLLHVQGLALYHEKEDHPKINDEHKRGKAGKETKDDQGRTNNFREDTQDEGPPVADVHEIVETVFILAEMDDLVQTVNEQQEEAEANAYGQCGEVKGALRILGGEEFFHVRFGIYAKVADISKEMLIDAVIHTCLERSLAKGKIIRIFNALKIAGWIKNQTIFQ